MNIFIYGNQNFKKDIQKILKDSKIDEKLLDLNIIELDKLDALKESIASNPDDVFLIDDNKIIKKSAFKFLKPKDGIEEEFLLACGVNDLSIDSLEEIPEYIIRKHDRQNITENVQAVELKDEDMVLDSELSELLESKNTEGSLENSILEQPDLIEPIGLDIQELDNLIETTKSEEKEIKQSSALEDFDEDFGLSNISFDYDDDSIFNDSSKSDQDILNDLLSSSLDYDDEDEDELAFVGETFEDVNFLDEIFPNKPMDIYIEASKKVDIADEEGMDLEEFISEDIIEPIEFDDDFSDMKNIDYILEESDQKKDKIDNFEEINEVENSIESLELKEEKKEEKIVFNSIEEVEEERKTRNEEKIEEKIEIVNTEKIEEKIEIVNTKGEDKMGDEFLELDDLNEQDLIDALGGVSTLQNTQEQSNQVVKIETIASNSSNIEEIASLISKLLNNKTLEITIKIKD